MKVSRTKTVAAIALATLALLLASWFRTGWQSLKSEAARLREQPERAAREELRAAAEALTLRLRALLAEEDQRPYYHYKNLFHDPTKGTEGLSVSVSPLAKGTGDPLISSHFQIGSEGKLTMPPINDELEHLSQAEGLSRNHKRLLALRAAQAELLEAPLVVLRDKPKKKPPLVVMRDKPKRRKKTKQAAPMVVPPQAAPMGAQQLLPPRQQQQRQQVFEQQAFAQNSLANTVFQELEGVGQSELRKSAKKRPARPRPAQSAALPDTSDKSLVQVSTHPFSWRSTDIAGTHALVALRRIDTPTGKLTQGFVVDKKQLRAWLAARALGGESPDMVHKDSASVKSAHMASVDMPNLPAWALSRDYSQEQSIANTGAAALRGSFLWRFVPVTLATIALLVMLLVVVSRAESLARERSQFAAAAAHELRTPLAGLQLYGDMLAEGLGDKDAKEKYARHIADEAQRLGRVVSNVLDFSQMEQDGLQLRPERGNLADTVRRVVDRMRHAMDLAGMKLELEVPEQAFAKYDDDAVYRILQNLMDNAEKYSRNHEDRVLRLALVEEEDLVRVSVSDGGPGVVSQMRQQIFKPFRRAAGEDGPAGLGLGLALARSLARQQGGNLLAEDSAFGGAKFVLEVPKT